MSKKYKCGQVVEIYEQKYILSTPYNRMACLISLLDGNRWLDPIKVSEHGFCTYEEIKQMSGISRPKVLKEWWYD